MKNIIIFILLIFITACNNSSNTNISKNTNETDSITNNIYSNKTLRVGIYLYDYPMLYVSNDNINGFDYDIINSIANEENLKLEFVPIQFSELIPALQTNYIDLIIAGMSITEERKQLVNFSDKYCSSGQGIILNKENDEIKVNDDLIGKTVGVIKGTISDNIISEVEGVNVERFDVASSALLSLKVNKIDAVMLDTITCEDYVKFDNTIKLAENISFKLMDYAIAVRKDDDILLQTINRGLHAIMSNGVYQKLVDKHL
ncbi:amino acid ABC transporter substrate-binding protein [Brachyspira hyodysenteriae]|uniref:basic amino acid ABC transporter substrate-binding protein n=1 Tax=Brachyspira hyodysenteriae TaxID=159 RepID=UPI00118388E0|nr:basic amino acid ABC transporter substrate-binding protein [Brachyspira hyodysenteriae]TVL79705.1 amino acid ABC transporter substrate-binding protein [Brachyspira hyodysenteriae]TVL84589.1 amino acid ABC transporter substrate-binding protein [Brachyspira hyodysenteriae]